MPRTPTTSAFPVCLPAGRGATPGRRSPAFLYLFWDVISARLISFEMPAGRSSAVPAVLLVWPRGFLLMEPAPPRRWPLLQELTVQAVPLMRAP